MLVVKYCTCQLMGITTSVITACILGPYKTLMIFLLSISMTCVNARVIIVC